MHPVHTRPFRAPVWVRGGAASPTSARLRAGGGACEGRGVGALVGLGVGDGVAHTARTPGALAKPPALEAAVQCTPSSYGAQEPLTAARQYGGPASPRDANQ